jgi:hypothetical protein
VAVGEVAVQPAILGGGTPHKADAEHDQDRPEDRPYRDRAEKGRGVVRRGDVRVSGQDDAAAQGGDGARAEDQAAQDEGGTDKGMAVGDRPSLAGPFDPILADRLFASMNRRG